MATFDPAVSLATRLGSDLSFPINGSFQPISGMDLLIQDIQLLLLTLPGERVNRPTFGCRLKNQIWENIDTAASNGAHDIKAAINKFEPRINLLSVDSNINRNTGLIIFSINFVVSSTSTAANLIFPLRVGTQLSQV
jgi:phage baseplate assembly protein W